MDSTRESAAFERLHRPYASMNWIRFNGSLRHKPAKPYCPAVSQPLAGTPLVNAAEATSSIQFMSTLELKVTRSPRTSGDAAGLGASVL
ncbi:hypothetical protein ATY76_22845 [Rhizobium sp. R339]|nr:hypothetical protein ATY76_22845 [Rhizobium sp. R339]